MPRFSKSFDSTAAAGYDDSQWKAEAEFFDRVAEEKALEPLDGSIVERYARPTGPWSIDFAFRVAGRLRGKTVLDVGAGTGENSLVFAALGAHVTSLDISPGSLEVVRRRAEISGIADRVTTVCSPLEQWESGQRFDIVWIDSFLHHVIPNLPLVLRQLHQRMKSDGRLVIAEPYAPRWLRDLRMALPIPTHGTPGERPLNNDELRLIREEFRGIRQRNFLALSRPFRTVNWLAKIDSVVLRIPGVRVLGSYIVLWT